MGRRRERCGAAARKVSGRSPRQPARQATKENGSLALNEEIEMTEMTEMALGQHRATVIESLHPASAMAYEFALQKKQARRSRRWQRSRRVSLAARRQAALGSGC